MTARPCKRCGAEGVAFVPGQGWACLDHVPARIREAAPPASANGRGSALRFVSGDELWRSVPPEPPWLWRDYLSPGAITMLAGKPKSGKSTLTCAIVEAIVADAGELLGRSIGAGHVVYVAEEGAGTLVHKLPASERVHVLTREAAWPRPSWAQLLAGAVAEARRSDAVLLVIDSLAFWAGFAEGQENDAGAAQTIMAALTAATSAGVAVLLVHHQRKSGGAEGDAVRGTGAIFGAVDLLVELERVGEDAPAGQRRLVALGRWTSTPGVLVIDRDPALQSWRVIGEAGSREETGAMAMRERILEALPEGGDGTTEPDLAMLLGLDARKFGKELRALVGEALVIRSGGGRKGDPYCYARPLRMPPADSPPTPGEHPASDAPLSPTEGSIESEFPPPMSPGGRKTDRPRPVRVEETIAEVEAEQATSRTTSHDLTDTSEEVEAEPPVFPLEHALDDLAEAFAGEWVDEPPAGQVWDYADPTPEPEPPPAFDLARFHEVRELYVCGDRQKGQRGDTMRAGYWRTGSGRPGVHLEEEERRRMLREAGYLLAEDVAEALGVTPQKVHAMRNAGKIVPTIDAGARSLYRRGDLIDLEQARAQR